MSREAGDDSHACASLFVFCPEKVVCLATAWKRPEKSGAVSQHDGFVLFVDKALGEVLAREPVLLSRKLAGRDSNPLDLCGRAMYSKPAAECVSICCCLGCDALS